MAFVKAGFLLSSRICQSLSIKNAAGISTSPRLNISLTPLMAAMPQKKKRKTDPMVIKQREEKRHNRIIKALKKMEKKERIPKPLLEIEPSQSLLKEAKDRTREVILTEDILDERVAMYKEWSRFCIRRHQNEIRQIDSVIFSQKAALEALREENEILYKMAIAPDMNLLPFKAQGPTQTPPIAGHLQDGQYEDITRQFAIQYADTKVFLADLLKNKRRERKKKSDDDEDDD